MKVFFYIGHPAQFHFYKHIIRKLKGNGIEVYIYIKTKDVLESLVNETGWTYKNIVPNRRGRSKTAIFLSLMKRNIIKAVEIFKNRPDLLISSDTSFSHNGFLFGIPCLCFMDDDFDAVGYYSKITYPFTSTVIAPEVVKMGKWDWKRISFKGYLKLGYLHRTGFTPDQTKIGDLAGKDYCLIRLSELSAHHDSDHKGVSVKCLINYLLKKYQQKHL
jgi:predicted glycosyltransferase